MMREQLNIVVRTAMRWKSEEELKTQPMEDKHPAWIRRVLQPNVMAFWDKHFNMPYHVFRQRIQRIAQETLFEVADTKLFFGFPAFNERINTLPVESFVLPIDDDDWLAPDLCDQLVDPFKCGVIWDFSGLDGNRFHLIEETPRRSRTNNCAMRLAWLKRFSTERRNRILSRHWLAGETMDGHDEQAVRGGLAIGHPGSITKLLWIFRRFGESETDAAEYLRGFLVPTEIPPCFAWTRPYYDELLALYQEAIP